MLYHKKKKIGHNAWVNSRTNVILLMGHHLRCCPTHKTTLVHYVWVNLRLWTNVVFLVGHCLRRYLTNKRNWFIIMNEVNSSAWCTYNMLWGWGTCGCGRDEDSVWRGTGGGAEGIRRSSTTSTAGITFRSIRSLGFFSVCCALLAFLFWFYNISCGCSFCSTTIKNITTLTLTTITYILKKPWRPKFFFQILNHHECLS